MRLSPFGGTGGGGAHQVSSRVRRRCAASVLLHREAAKCRESHRPGGGNDSVLDNRAKLSDIARPIMRHERAVEIVRCPFLIGA